MNANLLKITVFRDLKMVQNVLLVRILISSIITINAKEWMINALNTLTEFAQSVTLSTSFGNISVSHIHQDVSNTEEKIVSNAKLSMN